MLDQSIDAVSMDYHIAFDEYGYVTHSLKRNRLVKRENQFRWFGAVHEYIEVEGRIFNSDIAIRHRQLRHDASRNLRIYENQLLNEEKFSPQDLFYFANELTDHGKYEQAINYYERFLETKDGWIEDKIAACGKLADCYFELDEKDKELEAIFQSFQYDRPRPEFCCS